MNKHESCLSLNLQFIVMQFIVILDLFVAFCTLFIEKKTFRSFSFAHKNCYILNDFFSVLRNIQKCSSDEAAVLFPLNSAFSSLIHESPLPRRLWLRT